MLRVRLSRLRNQVGSGLCFSSVESRLYGGDKWGQASASRRSNPDSTRCIETNTRNERKDIFRQDADRLEFLSLLATAGKRFRGRLQLLR